MKKPAPVFSRSATLLAASLVCLAGVPGCKGKPAAEDQAPKDAFTYVITFTKDVTDKYSPKTFTIGDDDIVGATVLIDGVEEGVLVERSGGPTVVADVSKKHAFASGSVEIKLRFPTPCGPPKEVVYEYESNVSAKQERADREHGATVSLKRKASTALPGGHSAIYIDDGSQPDAKITFGSAEVKGARVRNEKKEQTTGRVAALWDITCAPKHVVKIDGKEVGLADSSGEEAEGFLISTEPGVCYEKTIRRYADVYQAMNGPGSSVFALPAGQVIAIKWSYLDHFLEQPPAGIPANSGSKRSALYRVACGEDHREAAAKLEKKGAAPPGRGASRPSGFGGRLY